MLLASHILAILLVFPCGCSTSLRCTINIDGLKEIDCFLGTFGAFLKPSQVFEVAIPSGGIDLGCDEHSKISTSKNEHAVLFRRGLCSFHRKALTAIDASAGLLILADSSSGSTSTFTPTIAEGGFGLNNLIIIGVNASVGFLLADHSRVVEGGIRLMLKLAGATSLHFNETCALRFVQCTSRASLLLAGGLITQAANALGMCSKIIKIKKGLFLSNPDDGIVGAEAAELSNLVKALLDAGLRGLACEWATITVILYPHCPECWNTLCWLQLAAGDAIRARSSCHRAQVELASFQNSESRHDDDNYEASSEQSQLLEQVLATARITAVDFLLTNGSIDSMWIASIAKMWLVEAEKFRSLPPSIRKRHLTLASALIAADKEKSVDGSTIWLVYTLVEELAALDWDAADVDFLSSCLPNSSTWGMQLRFEETFDISVQTRCCDISREDIQLLERLLDIHVTIALFLDETGFYEYSNRHLNLAAQLASRVCHDEVSVGLNLRRMTSTPTIFPDEESMLRHRSKMFEEFDELMSPGMSLVVDRRRNSKFIVPFRDPTLAYTITPATMMIGYQGLPYRLDDKYQVENVAGKLYSENERDGETRQLIKRFGVSSDKGILRKVSKAYGTLHPQLLSVAESLVISPENSTDVITPKDDNNAEVLPKRTQLVRVGFVSSYLRQHSVGRLVSSIVTGLDRLRIDTHVCIATHFFRATASQREGTFDDEVTSSLSEILGPRHVHVLPSPTKDEVGRPSAKAIEMVKALHLDVLIYPELGMDALMVLFAMHRFAPVQCVFWGHPISQGLPSIDYFISSDLFESLSAEKGYTSAPDGTNERYHEQLLRLDGLSTFFARPKIETLRSVHDSTDESALKKKESNILREMGLPSDSHIYFVPQTLMKFHVDFDRILVQILTRDERGVLVITYSPNQGAWQLQLENRIAQSLSTALGLSCPELSICTHSRIRFIPSLAHSKFLDLLRVSTVVLDPFPFGGGVTSLEALASGTPVVTLPSYQTVVQLAAGFYRYMDSTSFVQDPKFRWPIARTANEYIEIALNISRANSGVSIREELNKRSSVLFANEEAKSEWSDLIARLHRSAPHRDSTYR